MMAFADIAFVTSPMRRTLAAVFLLSASLSSVAHAQPATAVTWGDAERRDWVFQAPGRGQVRDIAWSGDGTRLGVASSSGTVSVVDAASGDVIATQRVFSTSYMETFSIALDEHGTHVHGYGNTGNEAQAFAWDVAADRVVLQERYPEHDLSYSPDGARGVYGGSQVCTYRLSSGRDIRCVTFDGVSAEAYWPVAGTIVVMGTRLSRAGTLRVLDATRLTERFHVDGALDWSLDGRGRTLVVLLADAAVVLDARTGAEQRRIPVAPGPDAWVVLADDASRLAIAREATTTIVSLASGRRAPDADVVVPGLVRWLARGRAIVTEPADETRRYLLPQGTRGMRLHLPVEDHEGPGIAWTRAGLAAGYTNDRIEISDEDGAIHAMTTAGEHSVWGAQVSESGSRLVIGGRFGLDAWTAEGAFTTSCRRGADLVGDRIVQYGQECTLPRGAIPYVQRLGGTELAPSGVVTLASGEHVRLPGARSVCEMDETDVGVAYYCESEIELVAGGAIVVNSRPGSGDGPQSTRLFDARTGRVLASLPGGYGIVVDPQGRWAAAVAVGHVRVVRLPEGTVSIEVGEEPEYVQSSWTATSADGARLAYSTNDPHLVHVLDPIAGREVRVVELPAGSAPRLSGDGSFLAYVARGALHVVDLATGRSTDTVGVTGIALGLMCEGTRAFVLDAGPHAFVRRELGACDPPEGVATGGGRFVTFRSDGVVRIRRVADGAELWLRSMRGEQVVHFAHDAAGHWWSDATGEVPMHARSGAIAEPRALEPSMRDPELLRRFFSPPGG